MEKTKEHIIKSVGGTGRRLVFKAEANHIVSIGFADSPKNLTRYLHVSAQDLFDVVNKVFKDILREQ